MPKVSVIIPCYNQGQYLDEAVESVLSQTFQDFEIIIVNDGSTDNTSEIAQKWVKKDNRIKLIEQENKGLPAARNIGISQSIGEYILALDADDKIGATYLSLAVNIFRNEDEIGIIYGRANYFGVKNEEWILPEFSVTKILSQNLIYCSAIFRRSCYDKTNGYNINMKYGWEDWDLWLSMIEKGVTVSKINEIVFCYRVKKQSMVNDIANETEKRRYLEQQLIENHTELYKKYFPEPLTMLRELDLLRKEKEEFERYKTKIYNSMSYKLGSLILSPIKWMRSLFKK